MKCDLRLATAVARTKADATMYRVKQFMRSLRSRLPFSRLKSSRLSSTPSHVVTWSTPTKDERRTLSSFENNTDTAPARSKTPRTMDPSEDVRELPWTVDVVDDYDAGDGYNIPDHHPLSIQAELGANLAILDIARKLPLDDLNMVGNCLGSSSVESSDGTRSLTTPYGNLQAGQGPWRTAVDKTVPSRVPSFRRTSSHSSESFPLRPFEIEGGIDTQRNSTPELPRSSSQTLSLSRKGSTPNWSFVCQSARHVEQKRESSISDSGSSFGSLCGWGVTHNANVGYGPSGEPAHSNIPSSRQWNAQEGDDEFDMLPDWSDVEDDPDYNVQLMRDSDGWSTTSIASSDAAHVSNTLVLPKVYVPSGYAAGMGPGLVSGISKKTKRKQDGGGEGEMPCKRRKLEGGKGEVHVTRHTAPHMNATQEPQTSAGLDARQGFSRHGPIAHRTRDTRLPMCHDTAAPLHALSSTP
jgi:hypothetical protein